MMQDNMLSFFFRSQSSNQRTKEKMCQVTALIFSIGSNGWLSNSNSPKRDPASPNLRMVSWKQWLNTPQEIIPPDVQCLEIVGSCNSFTGSIHLVQKNFLQIIHPLTWNDGKKSGRDSVRAWATIVTFVSELYFAFVACMRVFDALHYHGGFSKKCPENWTDANTMTDVCFVGCFAKIPRQIQNNIKVGNFWCAMTCLKLQRTCITNLT